MIERVNLEEIDDAGLVQTRRELAACYRLIHHFRMSDLLASHVSARIPARKGAC